MLTPLLLCLSLVGSASDEPKSTPGLTGTWSVTAMEIQGTDRHDPALEMSWTFKAGDLITSGKRPGSPTPTVSKATYEIKPGADPKTVDVQLGKSATLYGIYKFEGETLVICYNTKNRPTEFVSNSQTKNVLMTFKKR